MHERAQSGAGAGPSGRRADGRENAGDTRNVGGAGEGDAEMEDAGPCPDRHVRGAVTSASVSGGLFACCRLLTYDVLSTPAACKKVEPI